MSDTLRVVFKLCTTLVFFSLCYGTVLFITAMLLVPTAERLIYVALSLLFLAGWFWASHKIEEMVNAEHGE